jgi:hypothetical protein
MGKPCRFISVTRHSLGLHEVKSRCVDSLRKFVFSDWSCRWGETSHIHGHHPVYCSSPGWCVSLESHGDDDDDATRALWQSYQQRHLGTSRRNGRRSYNFPYQYLRHVSGSLTCRILRHGTSGFNSHLKEGVLRIFIALKNPSPRPCLKPRPLCPVVSTLTTTPPRRLSLSL